MSRGPAVVSTLLGLRARLHADRRDIVAFQDALLRRLVRHAYAQVPYYRDLFDRAGVDPRRIRGVADLSLIPISSKADLRARPLREIVARQFDPARLLTVRTSGSAGQPFAVRRTWLESALQYLLRLRALRQFGIGFTDRMAVVGLLRGRDPRDRKLAGRLLTTLGVKRRLTLSGIDPPETVAKRLAEWQPTALMAMSGMLCRVADHVLRHGRRDIRPRAVIVGGEVTTPPMRRRLAEAFGAPVFEMYGSHEIPMVGWQCPHAGGFHVCDDGLILEVVRDGVSVGVGERGEVVATNLHAYAMPLIRYRLADVVTRGPERCACGQPFSTISSVDGRVVDTFTLPDGSILDPYAILIPTLMADDAWLAQYQLLQERRDRIVLRVKPITAPSGEQLTRMAHAARSVLGPNVEFDVIVVDDLPLEPTGKFRPLRSLVPVDTGRSR